MWLVTSLSFFYFFFLLSSARIEVAFLDRSARSIRQNACFWPRMYLLRSRQYGLHLGGQTPKNLPKWAGISILQPNRQSSRSSIKIFALYFTDTFSTGGTIEKVQIRSKRIGKGSRDLIYKFSDPPHVSGMVQARNFKFGMHVNHEGH